MNANIKYQVLGAVIGAGLGYITGSVICDTWCPEYEEVEINVEGLEKTVDLDRFERGASNSRRAKKHLKGKSGDVINYNQIRTKGNIDQLHEIARTYSEMEKPGKVVAESIDDIETPDPVDPDAPYVITDDEHDTLEGYSATRLNYYVLDDVMTDESDVVVGNPENIIGDEALTCFGQDSSDADVVFVRNPLMRCDYEITRLHKSYTADVLGLRPATRVVRKNTFVDKDED